MYSKQQWPLYRELTSYKPTTFLPEYLAIPDTQTNKPRQHRGLYAEHKTPKIGGRIASGGLTAAYNEIFPMNCEALRKY